MTSYTTNRTHWWYRGLSLGGAIVVMIASAGAAAIGSYNAAKQQRRAAERTLRDYAVFASYTYSQNAYSRARDKAVGAFAGLMGFSPRSSDQLPPETVVLPPAEDCASSNSAEKSGESGRYRFRLDLPSRVLHISLGGDDGLGLWQALDHLAFRKRAMPLPVSQDFETRLSDTLAFLAGTPPVRHAGWGYAFVRNGNATDALSFHAVYTASGVPVAVYGYQSCIGPSDFEALYREVQPLPPALTFSLPRDSLLLLRVTDRAGTVLYTSSPSSQRTLYTGVTTLPLVAGLNFAVAIPSSLALQAVREATSPWETQRALAFLVLTIGLGILALLLFRREAKFVRTREDFVTDVSHELRTPLQQILLFAQLLRLDRLRDEGERARSLTIIETETQRLISLVANLLDKARPEAPEPASRLVDIQEVVQTSIALFQPLAAARRVTITMSGENALAIADPEALHQILVNLLDNAVKYGPPGQIIQITTEVLPEWVIIHVDDQGPGIPAADREKAWEPFVRLGPMTKRSSGGVGIGLAIVRAAVQRMSGTITISDSPSGGARLTMRLIRAGATEPS